MGWSGPFFFTGRICKVLSGVNPVQAAIERTVVALGYELVDLEFAGRGLLRVFIDLPPGSSAASGPDEGAIESSSDQLDRPAHLPAQPMIRVEDCERVSHQLTHVLTVENIDYDRLEVSSPGMDRPLKKATDYERFVGEMVSLRLRMPLSGRRNFVGLLVQDEASPGGWALDLVEAPAKPAPGAKRAAGGKAAARAKPVKAAATDSDKGEQTVRRLSFELEDVERARLVPPLKF